MDGDMIYYDGFNWVTLSTQAKSAGDYYELGTDGFPKLTSKAYLYHDLEVVYNYLLRPLISELLPHLLALH